MVGGSGGTHDVADVGPDDLRDADSRGLVETGTAVDDSVVGDAKVGLAAEVAVPGKW